MHHSIIEPLEARIAPATIAISAGALSSVDAASGDKTYVFHVTLTDDAGRVSPFTVDYATHDAAATSAIASAHGGTDYAATSGTLTFGVPSDPTQLTQTQDISVVVKAHGAAAPLSAFTVDLANAAEQGTNETPVSIAKPRATELIGTMGLAAHNTSVTEGSTGTTTAYFAVSLSKAAPVGYSLDLQYQTVEPPDPTNNPPEGNATSSAGNPAFYDYTAISGAHLTMTSGQTVTYIPVSVVADKVYEPTETFGVKVVSAKLVSTTDANTAGDITVTTPLATGTILNDDAPGAPKVQVTANAPTVLEGGASTHQVNYTVSLTQPVAHTLIVNLDQAVQPVGGTAAHSDVSVTIPAGKTSATLTYSYNGDSTANHDIVVTETIKSITLNDHTSAPTIYGVTVTPDASHAAASTTILDDDALVSIANAPAVNEGNSGFTQVNFPVTISQAADHDVVVTYSTVDGTATSTGSLADFVAVTNGHVTIAKGQTSANIPVQVIGDTMFGPDESFSVHLSSVTGAILDTAHPTGSATIQNDDAAPTVSIVAPTTPVSVGGTANFTAKLAAAAEVNVVVHYTAAGDSRLNVPAAGADVTIPAGMLQATVPIAITNDAANDPQTDFTVTLSSPTNATLDQANSTATETINPANLPLVTIADASYLEGAAGAPAAHNFTISLSSAPTNGFDVVVSTVDGSAKAGTDYVAVTNQTVHFAPGDTSHTVSVNYLGNDTVQADRTFSLKLSLPSTDPKVAEAQLGAHNVATATIQDDDSSYSIVSTADSTKTAVTVTEGTDKFASYTVTRTSGAVAGSVQFSTFTAAAVPADPAVTGDTGTPADTATPGKDYSLVSTTLHFNVGQASQTVLVPILDDTRHENAETFSVQLTDATNGVLGAHANTTGQVTIMDNDAAPVVHVTSPAAIKEGNSGSTDLVFNVLLNRGNDVGPVTVDYSTIDPFSVATAAHGTLTFLPNGPLQQQVIVHVPGNTQQNALPVETFKLQLSNATNATLDSDPALRFGSGTVIDDDRAPIVSVSSAATTQGGQETFNLSLSNASAVPIQVFYYTTNGVGQFGAKSGVDFNGNDAAHLQPITFDAGTTTQTITIDTAAPGSDPVSAPDESFQLHLAKVASVPTSAQVALGVKPLPVALNAHAAVATGTIINANPEVVSLLNDPQVTRTDSGDQFATFTVSLLHQTALPVTVAYGTVDGTATVANGDYAATTGTLLFKPGASLTQTITVPVHGSLAHEADETFSLKLTAAKNAALGRAASVGTIVSSVSNAVTLDLLPATATSSAVVEGNTVDYIPTLSRAAEQDVTFTVSTAALPGVANVAVPGVHFVGATQTFTIKQGHTTPDPTGTNGGHFKVTTIDDGVFDPVEQFAIKVTNLTNAVAGHTNVRGTILNQDISIGGRVAKWTDVDGDAVTLTVSQGTLNAGLFSFTAANSIGGHTLNAFNIFNGGQQFLRASISITATEQKLGPAGAQGDGLVNVVSIISNNGNNGLQLQGFDLGNVSVAGNLDQIEAGDTFTDAGVRSLHVHSFGTVNPGLFSFVAEGISSMVVDGNFSGNLQVIGAQFGSIGGLVIGGALQGVKDFGNSGVISLSGTLGAAKIGSIVGASAANAATISAGNIGHVAVLGNIDNSAVVDANPQSPFGLTSAIYAFNSIGTVTVGGSIMGGSIRAQNSIGAVTVAHDFISGGTVTNATTSPVTGIISAGGLNTSSALSSVIIHGNVSGAKILAGYQISGDALSADAQIGLVQVDGNVTGFDVVAGAAPGTDGVYGTADDAKLAGIVDNSAVFSKIARVIIGGTVTSDGHTHGIVAQEVDAVSVGGTAVRLTGAPNETVAVTTGTGLFAHEIAVP